MTEETLEETLDETLEKERRIEYVNKIIDLLNEADFRVSDLVQLYGELGYSIGCSIEGYDPANAPDFEELKAKYYTQNTIGVSLMLQGLLVTAWHEKIPDNVVEDKK